MRVRHFLLHFALLEGNIQMFRPAQSLAVVGETDMRFASPQPGLIVCTLSFVIALTIGELHAGEAYYVLMFGSQRIPNEPAYSHTFATFVKVAWEGDGPCPKTGRTIEAHTISWMPRSMVIRPLALCAEPGWNMGLIPTLDYALASQERIALWGPYAIKPELYRRALCQIELLNSGQVRYQADDCMRRSDRVSNCIHAVSSIAEGHKVRVAPPGWGQTASFVVLRRFLPWVIDSSRTHDWVVLALGLDAYPIYYREIEPPFSGAFIGPVYRLLGGERNLTPSFGPPASR
jgi:hypothetical protein